MIWEENTKEWRERDKEEGGDREITYRKKEKERRKGKERKVIVETNNHFLDSKQQGLNSKCIVAENCKKMQWCRATGHKQIQSFLNSWHIFLFH